MSELLDGDQYEKATYWRYPPQQKEEAGKTYDSGKSRMDLLPFDVLVKVGDVLAYGASKYDERNWEKGMSWCRHAGCALRHLAQWMCGNDIDAESGLHHLDHAVMRMMMLRASVLRKIGTDDRGVKP